MADDSHPRVPTFKEDTGCAPATSAGTSSSSCDAILGDVAT